MKKLMAFMFLGLVSVSYADHSLKDIAGENTELTKSIKAASAREGVVCDLANSSQIKAGRQGSGIWRQVSLCYNTVALMQAAQNKPVGEVEADAILDVTYKFGTGDAFKDAAILKFDLN